MSWVQPRPGWTCDECGFVYDEVDPTTVADALDKVGKRVGAPLTRGLRDEDLVAAVRTRPEPEHWSALEYACHVRDCLDLYDDRIARTLAEDRPDFAAMDRDEIVTTKRYNEQDPSAVAGEVEAAATALAGRLRAVPADAWQRAGTREGEAMSIDWMARNVKHEIEHHLLDIGRALRHVRGR